MNEDRLFDHQPDPALGAALRRALETPAPRTQEQFVARVLAAYETALEQTTVPTWQVLAGWARPGIAAAVLAAAFAGVLLGRALHAPDAPATIETAIVPTSGPGLTALVTAQDPPDASVVFASLVEQR